MANTKINTKAETEAEAKAREEAYYNEKVPVFVRRPTDSKDNSCTITMNGTNYQIMYDVEVMVPRFVALILDESERNERIAGERAKKAMKPTQLAEF